MYEATVKEIWVALALAKQEKAERNDPTSPFSSGDVTPAGAMSPLEAPDVADIKMQFKVSFGLLSGEPVSLS
jgi:hypothetical protein